MDFHFPCVCSGFNAQICASLFVPFSYAVLEFVKLIPYATNFITCSYVPTTSTNHQKSKKAIILLKQTDWITLPSSHLASLSRISHNLPRFLLSAVNSAVARQVQGWHTRTAETLLKQSGGSWRPTLPKNERVSCHGEDVVHLFSTRTDQEKSTTGCGSVVSVIPTYFGGVFRNREELVLFFWVVRRRIQWVDFIFIFQYVQ